MADQTAAPNPSQWFSTTVNGDPFSQNIIHATPAYQAFPVDNIPTEAPTAIGGNPNNYGAADEEANQLSYGLSEKAAALGTAIPRFFQGNTPDAISQGQPATFSQFYHQALNERRQDQGAYETQHPVTSRLAYWLALPAAAGGEVFDAFKPAAGAVVRAGDSTVLGRMATGAKQGATAGAIGGFGATNDQSLAQDLESTGIGAALGLGIGATLPPVVEHTVAPLFGAIKRGFGGANAVQSQALQRIALRISQDGNGATAQDMLDLMNAGGGKPLMLADVGGKNVLGEGGRVFRAPGQGKDVAFNALQDRDKQAGPRLMGDVNSNLANGGSTFDTANALSEARATAAKPLYQQAYDQNQTILSPDITAVLKTPAGKKAMAQSSELMQNDGLVPSSGQGTNGYTLEQLDYAKRALDDQISTAQRGGNANEARILVGLKNRLLTSIDSADTTAVRDATGKIVQPGVYSQARSAWSGPTQSMDALDAGAAAIKSQPDPAQIKKEFDALSPGDQEFYRLGAANQLKQQIGGAGKGANEANRIAATFNSRNSMRALFPDDASYNSFMKSVDAENNMFSTTKAVLGNSLTAERLTEDDTKDARGEGGVGGLAQMVAGLATNEHIPTATGAISFLRGFGKNRPPMSPAVNEQIAKLLFNPDYAANQSTLAELIGRGTKKIPRATVPLASLMAQTAPVLQPEIDRRVNQGINWLNPAGQ